MPSFNDNLPLKDERFLVSALNMSDKDAFDHLFRRFYPMLCAYGRRYLSLEDSEEVVQDVFYELWKSRKNLSIKTSLSSYLFRSVRNRALNCIRNANERKTVAMENLPDIFFEFNGYEILELQLKLKEAVQELPESYKEAFIMNRFEDKTYAEIANETNTSVKTIEYRISKALNLLREKLKYLFLAMLLILR